VLLYNGNNNDDPQMVRLDDVLKSITKCLIGYPGGTSTNHLEFGSLHIDDQCGRHGHISMCLEYKMPLNLFIFMCIKFLIWLSHISHDLNTSQLLVMCLEI
jgi:hypothetical protein